MEVGIMGTLECLWWQVLASVDGLSSDVRDAGGLIFIFWFLMKPFNLPRKPGYQGTVSMSDTTEGGHGSNDHFV